MRNLKKMIGIAIAVGLTMVVFGCGGSGFLSESPTEVTGEGSYPVSIRITAETDSAFVGANKDAGGTGTGGLGAGDVGAAEDWYRIIPYITWAATTSPSGYEIVSDIGDCGNPAACLACNGSWASDLSKTIYTGVCEGQLPEAAKADSVPGVVHMYHYIRTTQNDGTLAAIRLDGTLANWLELESSMADLLIDSGQYDFAEQLFAVGHDLADEDLVGCDGVPSGSGESPMSATDVDPFSPALDYADASSFSKGITVNPDMGDNFLIDGITAHRCHYETNTEFSISLAALPGTVDMERGDFVVCGLYCNDINFNCDAGYCAAGALGLKDATFMDPSATPISNGASNVMLGPAIGISIDQDMPGTLVAENFAASAPLNISDVYVHPSDGDDAFVNDDLVLVLDNVNEAQLSSVALEMMGARDTDGKVQLDVFRVDVTSGCAVDDLFLQDSFTDSSIAPQGACYDFNRAIPNALIPITSPPNLIVYEDAENPDIGDIAIFHADNGQLQYRDAGKQAGQVNHAQFIKAVGFTNTDDFRLDFETSGVSGIDDTDATNSTGDDHVLAMMLDSTTGTGYVVGWQAVYDGANWIQAIVGYELDRDPEVPADVYIDNGAYVDATALTDVKFRILFDKFEPGNVSLEYFVTGQGWINFSTGTVMPDAVAHGNKAQVDYMLQTKEDNFFVISLFSAYDSAVGDNFDSAANINFYTIEGAVDEDVDDYDLFKCADFQGPGV